MSNLFGMSQGRTAATTQAQAMGIDLQGAQYGPPIPVAYGQNRVPGNVIWYGDFQSQQHTQKVGKGFGGGTSTSYTYSASYLNGVCEGPITGIVQVWSGNSTVLLSTLAPFSATGTAAQAPWAHLPSPANLSYAYTALFGVENMALGGSPTLPNYNYEVAGLEQYGSGIVDANPAAILTDICTSTTHGVPFSYLGSLTQYSAYCVANGLFLSPVYDQQSTAVQVLTDLFKATNTYAYWSEGQLKVVPLGDVAVTGNGVTYTPNVTPVANLGPGDFIVSGNASPVQVQRQAPQDCYNAISVQFEDRANTYHQSAVVASIDEDMITNGSRMAQMVNINGCVTASVARFIAQNMVQRVYYVRNQYKFRLSWRYCYLEPTDILTLTDTNTGLNLFPVRILEVAEDADGLLDITAEEFPEGIGHSAIYGTQPNAGTNVDPLTDPGPVNAPYLFRMPGYLVGNGQPEIGVAVCGSGALWGGADIWISYDGTSYQPLGSINAPARYGVTTTSLAPATTDPDTTTVLGVQLYTPGTLLGATQADADNLSTLCMVANELLAYENATLTGANAYNLTYLRRDAYGTSLASTQAGGTPFVRLDEAIFRFPVDPSLIGTTVYVKFLSVNSFGRTPRTLAEETAYTYVIGSSIELPDVPPTPTSFAALAVADGVQLSWTNPVPAAVSQVAIYRAAASTGPFSLVASVGNTTTTWTDHFTNGATWYYYLTARGPLISSGWSADTSTISSTGKTVANGATAGATIGPGGNVGGAVDANGRALIDFTQSGHLGKTLANVADTATRFAAVQANADNTASNTALDTAHVNGVLGTAISPIGSLMPEEAGANVTETRISALTAALTNHTLDNLGDGTTYARTAASDLTSNRIDFSKGLLNKQLDNIPDGTTYIRGTASMGTASDLPIQNALCSEPLNSDSSVPGWIMPTDAGSALYYDTGSPDTGYTQDLVIRTPTTPGALGVNQPAKFACRPGDSVAITARVKAASGIYSGAFLDFYNAANSNLGNVAAATTTTVWTTVSAVGIAPAGTAYAQVVFYCGAPASGQAYAALQWVRASINDVRVAGSGAKAYIDFSDNTASGHLNKTVDYIGDGTTYARIVSSQLTSGAHKLTVAGSGMLLGDKRNLPQSAVNNISSYYSQTALNWSAALSSGVYSGSITSGAFTAQYDGNSISYNASSVNLSYSGTGGAVQYWIYFDDPTHAGGTPALVATITQSDCFASAGRVYLGSVSVNWPAAAGTNTGGFTLSGSKWSRVLMVAN